MLRCFSVIWRGRVRNRYITLLAAVCLIAVVSLSACRGPGYAHGHAYPIAHGHSYPDAYRYAYPDAGGHVRSDGTGISGYAGGIGLERTGGGRRIYAVRHRRH